MPRPAITKPGQIVSPTHRHRSPCPTRRTPSSFRRDHPHSYRKTHYLHTQVDSANKRALRYALAAIVQAQWVQRASSSSHFEQPVVGFGKAGRMEPDTARRVVTVFRSGLRHDAEANGYDELAARVEDRARAMSGFIDFKTFSSPDGERLSVIVFDTIAHQHAWRDDPEHRVAQQRGREAFSKEYSITVCQEITQRSFPSVESRQAEHES